ncbi:MAG: SPOR domain-containing protein [Saccharospirillum sp.]|nr:SPOR domain-containing protein [Saccharospirillum sp.]
MARDYASRPPPPEPQRSRIPGWVWMFTTLTAVGFVGFLYYLSQITPEEDGAAVIRETIRQLPLPEQAPQTDAQPETDDTVRSLERAFEFYRLLRDDEVPITLPELPPTTTIPAPSSPSTAPSTTPIPQVDPASNQRWIIQVASFNQVADADRLRAELIMNGLTEAQITTVDLGDRGTFHRVTVGPFDNRSRLNRAQDILVGLNMEVMVRNVQ